IGALREIRESSEDSDPDHFEVDKGKVKKVPANTPQPYPHGNGCWRMPASDLLLFAQAMNHNSLITHDSFQAMLAHDPPLGFKVERGEGAAITDPIKFWGHPGGYIGQTADLCSWNMNTDPPSTTITAAL